MRFDRKMVGYLQEIKRRLPPKSRVKFKFSEPYIERVVFDLYQSTENTQLKILCKSFLENAGEKWIERVNPPKPSMLSNAIDQSTVALDKLFNVLTTPIKLEKFY